MKVARLDTPEAATLSALIDDFSILLHCTILERAHSAELLVILGDADVQVRKATTDTETKCGPSLMGKEWLGQMEIDRKTCTVWIHQVPSGLLHWHHDFAFVARCFNSKLP